MAAAVVDSWRGMKRRGGETMEGGGHLFSEAMCWI